MKKKLAGTWKKNIGYWLVQINGNKFATGQILEKPVEVVKGQILAGWAPKFPEPCLYDSEMNTKYSCVVKEIGQCSEYINHSRYI